MRPINLLLCSAVTLLIAAGCDNSNRISENKILSLITEELADDMCLYVNTKIKTGFYEENDDDVRFTLRKLAVAGVITYKAEKIQKTIRYKSGYDIDWANYRMVDTYKSYTKDYYFVTVELTEQGNLLTELDLQPMKKDDDKLLLPVIREKYPEDDVEENEVFPGDKPAVSSKTEGNPSSSSATQSAASKPEGEYEEAKARENYTDIYIKAYKVKVADVRNILVKDGQARSEFILEAYDVTPAGRIFKHIYQGQHGLGEAKFVYFQDKGWSLSDMVAPTLFF